MVISVIIPFCGRFDLLDRAIRSVISQKFSEDLSIEIVLIDDGSDEDYQPELNTYEHRDRIDIKLIKLPVNRGVSTARNVGISNSTGEYIFFLDSDDQWLKCHVETSLDIMLNQQKDALCSSYFIFNNDKIMLKEMKRQSLDTKDFSCTNPVGLSTLAVSANLIKKHDLKFPEIRMRNDFIFLKELAEVSKIWIKKKPSIIYFSKLGMTRKKYAVIKYQWLTYYIFFNYSILKSVYFIFLWAFRHAILFKIERMLNDL